MSKKIVNSIIVVISVLLVIGFIYYGSLFLQNKRQMNSENTSKLENQTKETTQAQDEYAKLKQDEKKVESTANTSETTENKDIKNEKELTPEEKNKQQALINMTDDELINMLGNIFQMPPQESITKYGADYISRMLKELGNRMKNMNEEQKQKVMSLLKTAKPPQINKDN